MNEHRKLTSFKRAIEYLDAVEVSPELPCPHSHEHMHEGERCNGVLSPARYAWRGPEFEAYVVASKETLSNTDKWKYWTAGIDEDDPVTIMPDWWSPEQRIAWRSIPDNGVRYHAVSDSFVLGDKTRIEAITADLESGAEVLA